MAGKGTYGAYADAKEVGGEFVDNLQHAERMGFRYRWEEERRKEKKLARNREIAKNLGTTLEELQIAQSGIKDLDLPVYDYITRTSKKLTDLARKIAEDENDFESQILYEKYQNSGKLLKGFVDKFTASQLEFQKGIAEGKYSEYNNQNLPERISKALLRGNYKLLNDKNGDLQLIVDADKDGIPDKYGDFDGDGVAETDIMALNVPEFLGGNKTYKFKERFYEHKEQDKIYARYGKLDTEYDEDGYMEIKYAGFDPDKEKAMRADVEELFGTYDKMTEQATSIMYDDMGLDPNEPLTEEKFKAIKKQFGDDILNLSDTTRSEKYNWRRKTAEDANARGWNADRRAQQKHNKDMKEEDNGGYIRIAKDPVSGEPMQLSIDGETEATTYTLPKDQTTKINGQTVSSVEMYGDGSLGFVITETVEEPVDPDNPESDLIKVQKRSVIRDKGAQNEAVRNLPHPTEDRNYYNLDEFQEILSISDELEDLDQQFGKNN